MKQAKGRGTVVPLAEVGSHQPWPGSRITRSGRKEPGCTEEGRESSPQKKVSEADTGRVLPSVQRRGSLKTYTQGALADELSLLTHHLPLASPSALILAVST